VITFFLPPPPPLFNIFFFGFFHCFFSLFPNSLSGSPSRSLCGFRRTLFAFAYIDQVLVPEFCLFNRNWERFLTTAMRLSRSVFEPPPLLFSRKDTEEWILPRRVGGSFSVIPPLFFLRNRGLSKGDPPCPVHSGTLISMYQIREEVHGPSYPL